MDGGARQEQMAKQVQQEVKEMARRRRGEHVVDITLGRASLPTASTGESIELTQTKTKGSRNLQCDILEADPGSQCDLMESYPRESMTLRQPDTVLFMFYIEKLLPFLFPFYNPSLLEGGKAWILELMIRRPLVRQAVLCQSFYFSLVWESGVDSAAWEKVLMQTQDAFLVLRKALQIINDSSIAEHLHGAARIMASIIQLQRFETAVLGFDNWRAHINAALALFRQLLDSPSAVETDPPRSRFNAVLRCLGPSSDSLSMQGTEVPAAEQAAFRFSSALIILDDIIASTVLQEPPKLYEYHQSLLKSIGDGDPCINLEAVIGVRNQVLLEIGEIATLDAWKQRCRAAGSLNNLELAQRATVIENSIVAHLIQLDADTNFTIDAQGSRSPLEAFASSSFQITKASARLGSSVTRVWAHAALAYLFIVVSGWQLNNTVLRHHVNQIVELLKRIMPPALLRTMVWPFCVAGCLAEPTQEAQFRAMVETLQPSVFGTVHKALRIMENVWRDRDMENVETRDLAMCFKIQGELVLLV
ncbi:MAG: hypothetical protein M1820_005907 [Bogoriella megaspora]|nr:MAG: hypothetical protein M1820_005907 [Bogoriella megaspora]